MNREELRDQLFAPVLQWTRLGRQVNALMIGSMEVIWLRSNGLLRSWPIPDEQQWAEVLAMTKEKIEVPIEALGATVVALHGETQQFLAQTRETSGALVSGALSLATGRGSGESETLPAALGDPLINLALGWYQLWGRAAEVTEQGLRPILRQVQDNASRLGQRG